MKTLYITKRQITFGAIVLLGGVMVADAWRLWSISGKHGELILDGGQNAIQELPSLDVSRLAEWELFGAELESSAMLLAATQVKATTLQLKLEGIIASLEGGSYALIDGAGSEVLYQEGDKLGSTGATLRSIQGDRVILDNNGSIEELALDESSTRLSWVESADGAVIQGQLQGVFSTNLLGVDAFSGVKQSGPKKENFLDKVSLSIIKSEADAIVGYRLSATPEVLGLFNLQAEDVLVGVNGQRMTSPLQALAMRHLLQGRSQVDLMIERHGNVENITINADLVKNNNE